MSLDYPVYEKIKGRNRWLGIVWRFGDFGYYVGLLGAVFALPCSMMLGQLRRSTHEGRAAFVLLSVCIFIFGFSLLAKRYVHKKAKEIWPDIYD